MCKKSLTQSKKNSLAVIIELILLFTVTFVTAANGDKETFNADSANQEKEAKLQKAEMKGHDETKSCSVLYLKEASESEMDIENWMLNPDHYFGQENEITLEIWMYDINSPFWQEFLVDDKEEYAIEDWMVNPSAWPENARLYAKISTD